MSETDVYTVPRRHRTHCEAPVKRELEAVEGVKSVQIDLER
jgi:copper chaperone CopZ